MGRLILLRFLGLLTIGYTVKCPSQETHEREILCYTSLNDFKQLEGLICRCTTIVHRGHDLQDLNASGLQGIRESLKNVNPGIQFVISIDDHRGSLRTSAGARQQAIARISSVFSEVDGVELNLTAGTKERLVHFIQGLKEEMMRISKERRILLALPTKEEPLAKEFDVGRLAKYVDLFTVPTHYLTDNDEMFRTFHPSRLMGLLDLLNADSLVDLIHGLGVDKKKILISVPASGYKFTLKDKHDNAPRAPAIDEKPTAINREEFCDLIREGEWTIEREGDLTAPYAFNNFTWIAFEDKISTRIKGKYVLLRDLAGLAIDQVENDSETNCGRSITEEVYHSFVDNERKTREAVLNSLQEDIDNTENAYPNSVKASNFRISRIVDSEGKIHSIRENMQTEFSCPRQGHFVHPKSCNRFYRCVKFNQEVEVYSVFEFDCPTGLSFDERTEVCVWPGSLPEGSPCPGSSEIAPTTPRRFRCPEEGYYADPSNCRWFFACIDLGEHEMTPYEFRCPYGLVFDERKLVCEWPWIVPNCTNNYGNNYEHTGGNKNGYGGLSSGAGIHLEDEEYNKPSGDGSYRYSQKGSEEIHNSSHYQYSTHSVSNDYITTTSPGIVFIPTSSTGDQKYNTLTPISQADYRGDGGRFEESQSTTEHHNAFGSIEVSSINSVSELEQSRPSESSIQASNSVTIGRFPTSTFGVSTNKQTNRFINPDFVNVRGTDEASETISIGNQFYMNRAGTSGIKTQPKYYPTSVSNTFVTLKPTEKYYPNPLGIKRPEFRVTDTGEITNHQYDQNPWLFRMQTSATPPAFSTGKFGSQYSPHQSVTSSYTPGLGGQSVLSTGSTRGQQPIDYTVKIPEGANGNQFFQNHASVDSMYKGNPFLQSTSLPFGNEYHQKIPGRANGNQFFQNHASVNPRYKGNPFLQSTSLTSSGNEYHTNQAGNEASTLSQPNNNGYKTNEYYDNGGRSTIRYNNGLIAYKFTDDDVRNGKVSIPATSVFFNQTSRPVIGIFANGNGSTRTGNGSTRTGNGSTRTGTSGTAGRSNVVGTNGPRLMTHSDQIGENAFTGSTGLQGNSRTQLNLSTPTAKPKFITAYSSTKPSVPIKTDGALVNDNMEKLTTQQSFFDIQVDNNRAVVTTSEPEVVNSIFSQSPAVQYSRPSTVEPIQYTTERLSNDGYEIEVSSTSIPGSINIEKYHSDNLSNTGVRSQGITNTIIQQKNMGKTFEYNGINHPDTTMPSATYQKQKFGEKIVKNRVDFSGSNQQNKEFVRPGNHYSPSTASADQVTHSKTTNLVNEGYSSHKPTLKSIDNSIPAARGTPAKSSSIPELKEVSKQRNYNRGNFKYTPNDDYDESEVSDKIEVNIITTQQPYTLNAVTTYNGGFRDSSTFQSSKISKVDNRGVVIKYSDLRPILLEKLGAECTCRSDPFAGFRSKRPLLINSSKGTIDLRDYDESDVYVDLELNKKSGEKNRLVKSGNPTSTQSPSDIDISASFNINRSKSRGGKNLPLNEKNFPDIGLLDNAECARPGLFRHPESCDKFYVCHWDQYKKKFTLNVSDCPVHLTFDSNAGACNWPSQGPACQVGHLLV